MKTESTDAVCPPQPGGKPAPEETSPARAAPPVAAGPFWHLWMAHFDALLRLSLRWMGGDRADAEDALSTAQLRALDKFGTFAASIEHPGAWLSRLLHNVCMDIHRRRKQRETLAGTVPWDSLADQAQSPGSLPSPEQRLLRRELRCEILRSIDALPPTWREAFLGRFLHRRSYGEIARRESASEANVRKRVQLARDGLQQTLEARGHRSRRSGRRSRGVWH